MGEDIDVRSLVTGSTWECIPVMLNAPAFLHVELNPDGTGSTQYERTMPVYTNELELQVGIAQGTARPGSIRSEWNWTLGDDGSSLEITWGESMLNFLPGTSRFVLERVFGTTASRTFTIADYDGEMWKDEGEAVSFTKKLTPTAHLFPDEIAGYPHGWPCEYFGYAGTGGR